MNFYKKRWLFILLGIIINLCLGTIYAYSVFRIPLENKLNITATESGIPFMIFLLCFSFSMPFGGILIEKHGPRTTAILGGFLLGIGLILASFSTNIHMITVFYGIISGIGVGIAYGCPLIIAAKWFPDKPGMAMGLVLGGFGLSPLITAPLIKYLIDMPNIGLMNTFLYLGIAFILLISFSSLFLQLPLKLSILDKKIYKKNFMCVEEIDRNEMIKKSKFYALWITYSIGCLIGLMAIGIASPYGITVTKITSELAALSISLFSLFNFFGRPIFGILVDKFMPKNTALLSFIIMLIASLILYFGGENNLFSYLIGFSLLWFCLGGWLALAPTATKIFFGIRHYSKNYGLVFTAYGIGGISGMLLSGILKDITGSYLSIFPFVILFSIIGAIISYFLLK